MCFHCHPNLIFAGKADAYGISVDVSLKARVFATAINFHSSITFAGKDRAYAICVAMS
jgi:hypothetical protein